MHAKSLQLCLVLCDPMVQQPTRLLCLWDSPGKNTGVGCHSLQGMFRTQESNLSLLHWQADIFFTTSTTWEALMSVYWTPNTDLTV